MMYLFKSELGNWAYFDKDSGSVVEVSEWKERSANIAGDWVNMIKYFRIVVNFLEPVRYSQWDQATRQNVLTGTSEALLTITKTAYDSLMTAKQGRPDDSWFRFVYKTMKQKGRSITYVNGVEYVDPVNIPKIPAAPVTQPVAQPAPAAPQAQPATSNQPPSDLAPSLPPSQPVAPPSGPALPNF